MTVLDELYNHNERLVFEEVMRQTEDQILTEDTIADVICVALNQLPAKYIRHSVDCAYYMSTIESEDLTSKVRKAVTAAIFQIATAPAKA